MTYIQIQSNPFITCYPTCLTSITSKNFGSIPQDCPDIQESVICNFVSSTNIASIINYDEWSCGINGVPLTDPCGSLSGSNSIWTGLSCSGGVVISLNVSNIGLIGELFTIIYLIILLF